MKFSIPFIPFMKYGRKGLLFSAFLTSICILLIIFRGFNFGLEFTGGATIELQYPQSVDIPEVRKIVNEVHSSATVVQYGSSRDIQIRFAEKADISSDDMMVRIVNRLRQHNPDIKLLGQAKIGGQYKTELIEKGLTAFLFASIGMIVYLSLRFEWKFAIGAVVAQIHDVIVTAGLFALTQWTFDLTVLAALLAVLGYSVNDTVVVYDRIRENFLKLGNETPRHIIDISVNQTLARTIVTGLTTLLAVLALLFFGGETLFGFAAALIFGIVFGTYSSIFVASALVDRLGIRHEDLLPKTKEAIDDLP